MTVIAVFNQKGGVGKTTTALNLLAAIARRGQRPLGIDLDPQAHLSHVFGGHPKLADDSVYSFFVHQRPLSDIARITKSGVALCPAHLELSKLDSLLGKGVNVVTRLRHALRQPGFAPGRWLSTAAAAQRAVLNAVFACDLLLVPVSAITFRCAAPARGRVECARAGVPAPAATALLRRVTTSDGR
jgi:chromosome partitioning protein